MKTKYLNLLCLLIINVSVLAQTRKQRLMELSRIAKMEKVYLTQQSYPENILQLQIVKVISLYPLKYNSHLSLKYLTLGMKPVMS